MTYRTSAILGLALVASIALSGCRALVPGAGVTAPAVSPESSASADPSTAAAAPTPTPAVDCVGGDLSISHVPYTIDGIGQYARVAVVGTVNSLEGGVWNTPDGSPPGKGQKNGPRFDPEILTPINVNVDQVLIGSPKPGTIRVLNEGGTAGCSVMNVPSAPRITKGTNYVFFLREGEDATGKKQDALDVIITAWPVDRDGNVATEEDGIVPLTEVVSRVTATTAP